MAVDSQTLQVAIGVIEQDGRFLIGKRAEGSPLAGYWEFPGGKVTPGESPSEAAVRECREETGLEVTIVGRYADQIQTYDHGTVHLHFFKCRLVGIKDEPPLPFQWVARSELAAYEFPAGNQRLIAQLTAKGRRKEEGRNEWQAG